MPSRWATAWAHWFPKAGSASHRKGHFQTRLVLSILAIGLATAVVSLSLIYFVGRHTLQQGIGGNFRALAEIAANILETKISQHIQETESLAASASVNATIEESNLLYEGSTDEETQRRIFELEGRWVNAQGVDAYLLELLTNKAAVSLREFLGREKDAGLRPLLFVTNDRGAVVAASERPEHYYYGNQTWWEKTYQGGKGSLYLSDIAFDPYLDIYTITIATPVRREDQVIGVVARVVDASSFSKVLENVRAGQTDHAMLATSAGDVIICPVDPIREHQLPLSFTRMIFQEQPGWGVTESGPHFHGQESISGYAPVRIASLSNPVQFGGNQWYVFTSQDPRETYGSIFVLLRWVGVSAVLGAMVLTGLGVLVSRRVVRPIVDLQKGAEIIGEGNLNHQIRVHTGDEIEDLATKFNAMTYKLKLSHIRLEEIVKERTRELEQSNRELTILYSLTSTLNHSIDLEEILSETLTKMLGVMKSDAALIWMPDPKTGVFSVRMAKQFDIHDLECKGILRIMEYVNDVILDTSEFWSSEDLLSDERIDSLKYREARYKSLVAFPLLSKYKVSGTLHLLYRNLTALTSKEEKLLVSLGSQIGVAIEHSMLFAKNLFKELEGPPSG